MVGLNYILLLFLAADMELESSYVNDFGVTFTTLVIKHFGNSLRFSVGEIPGLSVPFPDILQYKQD